MNKTLIPHKHTVAHYTIVGSLCVSHPKIVLPQFRDAQNIIQQRVCFGDASRASAYEADMYVVIGWHSFFQEGCVTDLK
jgi:hypothetical protein